ncbi:uncharacterized protein LOC113793241 [Dermatophagoides pteronyssinus]|uniref:uncharacterized protein LOC113793241 n=1 Tax=Dermatophagoides pteronyssinus TaxID=6956 RepID=UPI003F67DD6D
MATTNCSTIEKMSCQKEFSYNNVSSSKCLCNHHLNNGDDNGTQQQKYRLLRSCRKFRTADQNISSSSSSLSTTFLFKYHHHNHYQKRHLSIIMNIFMIVCFAYLSISEVAFCFPENKNSHFNINKIQPNYYNHDKNDQSVTIGWQNIQHDDQNYNQFNRDVIVVDNKIVNRRSKRELFILPENENVVVNNNDNVKSSISSNNKRRENQGINQTIDEYCPSKECFRKVANFERFLRLYAQKNQHLTQFECVLRDIFFNCIKASARKQPKKPCKKKRYSQTKKRIAKLLSDTRLCIGA